MEIEKVAWSDADAVRRLVAVTNAAVAVDSPWLHPLTEHECVGDLRHGWDGEPKAAFLAAVDGVDVGWGGYEVSAYDNLHLAWLEVEIVPALRRPVMAVPCWRAGRPARSRDVRRSAWPAGTQPGRGFAARHGFEQRSVEVHRRQYVGGPPARRRRRPPDYELVRWPVATPAASWPPWPS